MPQFRAVITGRVQGVCFRAETAATARTLGLHGYARNLPNGSVEVVAGGPRAQLDSLLAWLEQGPPLARVDDVDVAWDDATPLEEKFEVRH
ncbi:MAG: acylphosphatase [Candidatus Eisenbacteria bacterium]|nr:acylphosphatase [Candidatus Eisenbacteria bacterium]